MSRRVRTSDLPLALPAGQPLGLGLYQALREAILAGRLGPGASLPSSRELAAQLGVARGTVVATFAQLAGEGYLTSVRGSGTRVAAELPDARFTAAARPRAPAGKPGRAPALSSWGRALQDGPFGPGGRRVARPFRAHIPALDAFPSELWGRLVARRARQDERLLLGDAEVRGYAPLRQALAEHLRVARAVEVSPERLVIVPSLQQALDLVTRLVLDPGQAVWMEDPGYTGARAVFQACGAKVVPVPVDARGLVVSAGVARAPHARLAYVTPGHQAPLGVTLSIERRLALLGWARARGAWVFEDDYDSEYRYEGRPVPALQSLDRDGRVIHAGTFSKTMLTSLRLAYVALPEGLSERFVAAKSVVDRFTPPLQQAALADFIAGGHFGRHLRRMCEIYAERRAALRGALAEQLGDAVEVVGARAGLDLALRLPPGLDDRAVVAALAAQNLEATTLSSHALGPRPASGLLLGFAAFAPARLREAVATLASVLARAQGTSTSLPRTSRRSMRSRASAARAKGST